jgi:hypothetical protein
VSQIQAFLQQPPFSRDMVTAAERKRAMSREDDANKSKDASGSGLSVFGVVAIVIMVGMLGWAGWYAVGAWNAMSGVKISPLGWVFMAMGAIVTFLVGAGLMALIFYSSRHDMDR